MADSDDAGATGDDIATGATARGSRFLSSVAFDLNVMRSLIVNDQNVRVDQGAWAACVCVKLHLRDELTNERRDGQRNASLSVRPFVRSFVSLSVSLSEASILWGNEPRYILRRNLRGGDKNPGSINTRNLVS